MSLTLNKHAMIKSSSDDNPKRSSVAPEMYVYPFTKYKGLSLFSYPSMKENPAKQLETVRNFISRPDDILMCTSTKAGTHWLSEIVNMVVYNTTEYNCRPDAARHHLDYLTDHTHLEEKTKCRRILHTHLPYNYIPRKHVELGGKIIYLNRNPKDRHVSQYNFFKNMKGFPVWTWEDYFDEIVRNDTLNGGWWEYTRQFEEALKTNPNILPVTFEELKLDLKGQIQRIGDFLGVETKSEFARLVSEKTTFKNLKEHKTDVTKASTRDGKSVLFRKGEFGDWKNYFTVAQNEEFDSMYGKEMSGFDVKFIYEYP